MDGKKRIARLRNAEKWKKLGFGGFLRQWKKERVNSLKNDLEAVAVGVPAGEMQLNIVRGKGKAKTEMTWDDWTCQYVPREKNIPGVFGDVRLVLEALKKRGYVYLGSGHYSTVLAHPKSPDKVIKITRHQDNWIDYVKWAAENGYAGGFGPKVYSWKKFPAGWSWAVMERMERCVGDDDYGTYGEPNPKHTGDDYEIIFGLLNAASRGNLMASVYAEDLCPGAVDYVKKLRSVLKASDIRGPNTMVRKDGSLCFTDPCAGNSSITTTRFKERDFVPSVWRYLIEGCYRH